MTAPPTTTTDDGRAATTLRYLPGLDGLRGISVLAVIVFHAYLVGGHEPGWAPGGFLGVEVFFAISGYLITSLLLAERRETGEVSYRTFYLRRARRLLPALWAMLAVVVAYALLFLPDAIGALRGDVVAALTYTSNWWQIIQNRSYFLDAGRPAMLKHLWSLAIEEQYYLIWPVALMYGLRKLGRQRMLNVTIITAFASAVLLAITVHWSINFAYYSTPTRLSGMMFGSAFAFYFAPYKIRGLPAQGARVALDVAGAAGLLFLLWSFGVLHFALNRIGLHAIASGYSYPSSGSDSLMVFHGGFVLVDFATLMVIAAAVHPASDVGRALGWKPLRWIGLRSYGLYLWHYPIMCVTRPGLDFENFFHLKGWPVFWLRLVLSFAAAEISYRYIESPIRHGAIGRYREHVAAAKGPRRQRLLRRGVVMLASLFLIAGLLGVGLAAAQPQVAKVPGIDEAAHLHDNGAAVDPSAIAALRGTSTTIGSSTATTNRGGTTPTTGKKAGTKPPSNALTGRTLAIGDSVLLGARSAVEAAIPGIVVDGKVSRQFSQAIDVVAAYKAQGLLPPTVVLHLGTNGRITNALVDQMMQTIGKGHQVYFLTARVPRPWESEVNSVLNAAPSRWKNAHVLEWHDFSTCHDDWFVNDGFHLRTAGQHGYAQFLKDGLQGHPDTSCKT